MEFERPRSTARIGTHPIHPMLIPFPIAFLVGALVTDLIFTQSGGDAFWARAGTYLLGAGIVMALLAAVFGFIDFFGSRRIRDLSHAWQHMFGNLLAVVVAAVNFLLRLGNEADTIPPLGLLLSAVTVAILLFTGWRGGDLVYRHGVGTPE
jgi:uncharacterized membrane protein